MQTATLWRRKNARIYTCMRAWKIWQAGKDSNLHPSDLETAALPLELPACKFAGGQALPGRLGPPFPGRTQAERLKRRVGDAGTQADVCPCRENLPPREKHLFDPDTGALIRPSPR